MSKNLHVLIVGSSRYMHRAIQNIQGVRTTLLWIAKRITDEDKEKNFRVLGCSGNLDEWISCAKAVHLADPFDKIVSFRQARAFILSAGGFNEPVSRLWYRLVLQPAIVPLAKPPLLLVKSHSLLNIFSVSTLSVEFDVNIIERISGQALKKQQTD